LSKEKLAKENKEKRFWGSRDNTGKDVSPAGVDM
jgi:hypothetical protein